MPETILPRGSDSFERQSGARFEVIQACVGREDDPQARRARAQAVVEMII